MTNSFFDGGPGRTGGMAVERVDQVLGEFSFPLGVERTDLHAALGRVLAESVLADRPVPPYNRVCMDGYALCSSSFGKRQTEYVIHGEARAGEVEKSLLDPQGCFEVMTGAVLPLGCDTVIPVERTTRLDASRMRVEVSELSPGANVHALGRDRRAHDEVLPIGRRLGPVEVAALASLGITKPLVRHRPRVVVVSSGDELVPPQTEPLAHQVRQSNVWGIAASLEAAGLGRAELLHVSDEEATLRQNLTEMLDAFEIVILSGGVSMGKWDLLPSILTSLGVVQILHGVAQQPGLPLWIGKAPKGGLVAGLPGNPVSAMTCLARHIHPLLERATGLPSRKQRIEIAESVQRSVGKTRFVPVRWDLERLRAIPVKIDGSGDWAGLVGSAGFVQVDPGTEVVASGTSLDFYPW